MKTTMKGIVFERPGSGTLALFGVPKPDASVALNVFDVYREGLRVVGVFGIRFSCGRALDLLAGSRVNVEPLISHRISLAEYGEGLAITADRGMKQKAIAVPEDAVPEGGIRGAARGR